MPVYHYLNNFQACFFNQKGTRKMNTLIKISSKLVNSVDCNRNTLRKLQKSNNRLKFYLKTYSEIK